MQIHSFLLGIFGQKMQDGVLSIVSVVIVLLSRVTRTISLCKGLLGAKMQDGFLLIRPDRYHLEEQMYFSINPNENSMAMPGLRISDGLIWKVL